MHPTKAGKAADPHNSQTPKRTSWQALRRAVLAAVAGSITLTAAACSTTTSDSGPAAAESASRAIALRDFSETALPTGIPVAFRLDDVLAHWCTACLTNVYNIFLEERVPLTVGVIGKDIDSGAAYNQAGARPAGTQMTLDAMSRFKSAGIPFEIASHSYSHPARGMPSLGGVDPQTEELAKAQTSIAKALGATPMTFIPPTNRVDAATYSAMKRIGLRSVSGQCTWPHTNTEDDWTGDGTHDYCSGGSTTGNPTSIEMDRHIPNNVVEGIRTVPAGVVIDAWSDFAQPVNQLSAYNWITTQYNAQGFAVIMLHPREMAADHCEGNPSSTLDQEKVDAIRAIISKGRQLNWSFATLNGLPAS